MMTFSLRPRRLSVLPLMAASVSTLVVSWKDDALMNDSVESDAFVMPSKQRLGHGGLAAARDHLLVLALERCASRPVSSTRKFVSPTSLMRTRRSI